MRGCCAGPLCGAAVRAWELTADGVVVHVGVALAVLACEDVRGEHVVRVASPRELDCEGRG